MTASTFVVLAFPFGILLTVGILLFKRELLILFGASEAILPLADFGRPPALHPPPPALRGRGTYGLVVPEKVTDQLPAAHVPGSVASAPTLIVPVLVCPAV